MMNQLANRSNLYRGKPRGYYDPTPTEQFFCKLGQAIYKVTDDKTHKSQMEDELWNTMVKTADKCVRFGTVWGPKTMDSFTLEEKKILKKFVKKI